jgi:histidine triad (HIT) family protein
VTDCLFCRIVSGEVPTSFLYADNDIVSFRDIDPQAPVHVLVVSRRHVENYATATEDDLALLGHMARVAAEVARREGIVDGGFRTVVNNGPDAQQSVPHLHMHVLGGRQLGWPPG